MRFLLLGALFLLIFFAVRDKKRNPMNLHDERRQDLAVEQMLCCAHCQVHFAASEAFFRADQVYCCDEHRLLHFP